MPRLAGGSEVWNLRWARSFRPRNENEFSSRVINGGGGVGKVRVGANRLRHFSWMINSHGIPRLILFISFTAAYGCPRYDIYPLAPFISSATLSHRPPNSVFFFIISSWPRYRRRRHSLSLSLSVLLERFPSFDATKRKKKKRKIALKNVSWNIDWTSIALL